MCGTAWHGLSRRLSRCDERSPSAEARRRRSLETAPRRSGLVRWRFVVTAPPTRRRRSSSPRAALAPSHCHISAGVQASVVEHRRAAASVASAVRPLSRSSGAGVGLRRRARAEGTGRLAADPRVRRVGRRARRRAAAAERARARARRWRCAAAVGADDRRARAAGGRATCARVLRRRRVVRRHDRAAARGGACQGGRARREKESFEGCVRSCEAVVETSEGSVCDGGGTQRTPPWSSNGSSDESLATEKGQGGLWRRRGTIHPIVERFSSGKEH